MLKDKILPGISEALVLIIESNQAGDHRSPEESWPGDIRRRGLHVSWGMVNTQQQWWCGELSEQD